MSRTVGVALEHRAALMGVAVHPMARPDSVSENTSSVVRSSRSCRYMANNDNEFIIMFITITTLIVRVFMSSKSRASISMIRW